MTFEFTAQEKRLADLVATVARESNMRAYIVGGHVRDRLLNRPTQDVDIVCVGDGIALAHAVARKISPRLKVTTYSRFGTAMLRFEDLEVEFVGARKESYRPHSRKPDVERGTLEDDQRRRDFTINALAVGLNEDDYGQLIDPFDGLSDLKRKIIRTPLEAEKTFSDDPLRMMRAIRFATQLGFTIEPQTLQGIVRSAARIGIVSQERITAELEKILKSPKPSVGFILLFETGLLSLIFPELAALHGVEDRDGKAHKDNFYHTLAVLDNLCRHSDNIWLRWAALLHDIAKPITKKYDPEVGWTFHGHEWVGANMVPRIFRRLRLPLDSKMDYVQKMVRLHLRPVGLTREEVTDSAVRRLLFEAGPDIDDLMLLCSCDITTKNPRKMARYLEGYEYLRERMAEVSEADRLRLWQPPINGDIIMQTFGIPPSREVGIIKTAVREAILDGEIPNEFDAAFERMLQEGAKLGLHPVDKLATPSKTS
ncbi:MAG: CCA tRNA nucleotidyltransferase [Saprospiraceae bacterium]|nr:CCA tRNA nucleotidyltransferase [Saprospiraceae bacterium]MDW8483583.1 HD domain-containing protein [Saprospiraceae bacterium]